MQRVKANSSKWMNEREDQTGSFAWQVGYGAFSVSESQMEVVRRYISRQEEHHRRVSFQDEIKAILRKHGFEADSRFLVD